MPSRKLTDPFIKRINPPKRGQQEYFDSLLPSFGLRVSYSGTKSWFVMTRVNGKLIRVTFGRYPALGLSGARIKARSIIEAASTGTDPRKLEEEHGRQHDAQARNTYGALTEQFMQKHVLENLRPSTTREYERVLLGDDTQAWRNLPITSIRKRDVQDLLDAIQKRGAKSASGLALAYLRKFFNWCADRDLIASSPTARIRRVPLRSRDRILSEDELRLVGEAFEAEKGLFGSLFKLLLLTGQRRGEVAGMRWEEVRDLNTANAMWDIPGIRTKNHQSHVVPLTTMAAQIIRAMPKTGPLVFSTTGEAPVSGFSKAKARVDLWIAKRTTGSGVKAMPPWSLHDLRRTMVTAANDRLSIPPYIVEAMVNHLSGPAKAGVAGVYNRATYLAERRTAAAKWEDYLKEIGACVETLDGK